MLNIAQEHPVRANLFAYCKNKPVNMVDQSGTIAANVIGAVIGGVIGAVGGYFLTRWLADRIGLRGWKKMCIRDRRYTPSTEWLHANERAYPVVLDPVVEA